MVLTDREEVLNIARNYDEETLGLVDVAKLNEMADAAILYGKGTANSFASSVNWIDAASQNHPLYQLYREIYLIAAAVNLIMRFPETDKDLKSLTDLIELKGPLLNKGVKEMATLGTDGGIGKIRSVSSISQDITYPKNIRAPYYRSTSIIKGLRGRY